MKSNKRRMISVSLVRPPVKAALLGEASSSALEESLHHPSSADAAAKPAQVKRANPGVRLSHVQAADVIVCIKENYDVEAGQYIGDVNDSSIATMMTFPCNWTSVASLRTQLFGNFKPRSHTPNLALESRVAKLEEFLKSLGFVP